MWAPALDSFSLWICPLCQWRRRHGVNHFCTDACGITHSTSLLSWNLTRTSNETCPRSAFFPRVLYVYCTVLSPRLTTGTWPMSAPIRSLSPVKWAFSVAFFSTPVRPSPLSPFSLFQFHLPLSIDCHHLPAFPSQPSCGPFICFRSLRALITVTLVQISITF